MTQKDYYDILGVNKSATPSEIKKAYHKLAMQYHPDRNSENKDSEKKFKEINEAYDVLKDQQKKSLYDQVGHAAFKNGGPSSSGFHQHYSSSGFHADINDIFGDFFSDFMGSSRGQRRTTEIRGSDLKYNLTITLEEAFKGTNKDIGFNTEVKCTTCKGSGSPDTVSTITCDVCKGHGITRIQQGFFALEQSCAKCGGTGKIIKNPCKICSGKGRTHQQKNLRVNIPAGIEDSTRIRLVGEGEAGIRGGNDGDLYVFVNIASHPVYKLHGVDLHCKFPISFVQAALGGELDIPNIDGEKIKINIPSGSQNNDLIKIKNKGMPKVRSSVRGDLIAHIHVEIPKNLTKKQKELLEEFGKESEANPDDLSFFDKMKNLWS